MKIFLGFLALVSFAVHHVTSLEYGHEVESWRTNPLTIYQNTNVRNPLLGSSASLTVLDKLQNIRNKMEEIEKKNTNHPVISLVRDPGNQFQSINSFVDDLSVNNDNKKRSNAFEIRPFSILDRVPVMPSPLNGYFMMFRLKQNISNSVPTKSQSRFLGNEQQHFIQQISTQKPETTVNQQHPSTTQRQVTSQQESLNNQQRHIRRLNIQDQSSNHGHLLSGQQNLVNQQQLPNNRGHQLSGQQRSINQKQPVSDQRSPANSQQFSSNEVSVLNGQQNQLRPVSNVETSINQQHSAGKIHQTFQQQPTTNSQQEPDQQGILSISHRSTINQYIRPQEGIPERIASNLPITENPTHMANNFEYPSGQQIQTFADEILAKIQTQALNGESQPVFTDNTNMNTQSRIISAGAGSHQASLLTDLDRSPMVSVTGSQILHETRLSTGASVKQHLKTPYANYDFSHLL